MDHVQFTQLRILVLISIDKPFVIGFHSTRSGEGIQWASVKYECLPGLCINCGSLGHFYSTCPSHRRNLQLIRLVSALLIFHG